MFSNHLFLLITTCLFMAFLPMSYAQDDNIAEWQITRPDTFKNEKEGNIFGPSNHQKANDLYDDMGYMAAVPLYEGSKLNLREMVRIANSYRLNHDTYNTEKWFAQVVEYSDEPIHLLYYAQALQSNGRHELAKKYFLRYDEKLGHNSHDRRGELLAAAIDRMNDFEHTEVQIRNEQIINTPKLDFSPTYYQDGIVYVSTRGDVDGLSESKDIWIDDRFMALYFAKRNSDGTLQKPKEFAYQLTTKYHEGPVTFSKNGKQIFFTRNNFNKGKRRNSKKGIMKLKIYQARKTEEGWSEAIEMPWNTDEYEECHPSLSADGLKLYFSSDRPGGFGGMDLYVSEFKNGVWQDPLNLGPKINTPGNDLFPFVHDDGTLYFASNGWGGLGGLDIFYTSPTSPTSSGNWTRAQNIGTPFNSSKDDFGFVLNVLRTEGYLTSARREGQGKDDIYSFTLPDGFPESKLLISANICAYDLVSEDRLEGVSVSIIESPMGQSLSNIEEDYVIKLIPTENRDEFKISLKREEENIRQGQGTERRYTTSQNGSFEIMLKPKREYLFVAKKNAYRMGEKVFSTRNINLEQDLEICIPLEKANCLNMEGVVLNKKYGNRIPNATVELLNQCTGEQSKLVTDEEGQFFFPCLACGCDFIISGHKAYFTRDTKRENTLNGKCEKGEVLKVSLELMPSLEPELTLNYIPNSPPGTNPYPNEAPNSNPANHSNSGYPFVNGLPTYNQIPITTGAIIELDNIYYDFDQSYIRSGAARELDRVADLMRRFPSLLIELNSHTDARGTNQYNEALSQKRAEEAVRYIASQGIDRRRLVAKGYGEQQLRNQCANQVDCSEEAHQYNRRTEIKVLYFDRRDVGVIYKDSGPEKIDRANPKRQFIWD